METLLRTHRGMNCLAVAAIFLAAIASTPAARGQYVAPGYGEPIATGITWLSPPTGVAVNPSSGTVYATGFGNGVMSFNTAGGNIQTFVGAGYFSANGYGTPALPVAVDSAGNVYVGNYNPATGNAIQSFNSSGAPSGSYDDWGSYYPQGMAVNGQTLYITDGSNSQLNCFKVNDTLAGPSSPPVNYPAGVAVDPNTGLVYVAEKGTNIIAQFDYGLFTEPTLLKTFGSAYLNAPTAVALSATGNLYVSDTGNHRIDVFTTSGTYLASFGAAQFGSAYANGVAVNPTGEIYVTTSAGQVLKYFDPGEWVSGTPHFDTAAVGPGQLLGTSFSMAGSQSLLVDGALTVQSGGTFTLAGSVQAGSLANNGQFALSGGTVVGPVTNNYGGSLTGAGTVTGNLANLGTLLTQGGQLAVSGSLTNSGTANVTAGGQVSAASITNNGQYAINGGTLTVSGGTVTNNASMTLNGGNVTAAQLANNFGATFTAAGSVTGNLVNYGTLALAGQLSINGTLTNTGAVDIAAGQQLLLPASTTTNSGLIALSGGAVLAAGAGSLANPAGGTIRGDGSIALPVANAGGLIYANGTSGLTLTSLQGNSSGGELRVADGDSLTVLAQGASWTNSSLVTLQGPNATLNGTPINNSQYGTISGQGRVMSNLASNYGTISAVGGQLVLAGQVTNGTAANPGSIESAAGSSVLVSQGLATNNGLIALTGGSFSNGTGNPMTNNGSILGNGAFSTGGLYNNATVTFSDGISSIFGGVTNNSGGTITTWGTSAAAAIISFYGPVINSPGGSIKINSSTARFLAGFTNNGTYITDPADNYFTGLAVGASGVLQGGTGDSFFVTGPFTSAGAINLAGNSQMVVQNGGTLTQTAGTLHLGPSATLTAGTVQINGGTLLADGPAATITANLVYASPSASTYGGILAGGGNSLSVNNPAAVLTLSGANNYTGGTSVTSGTLVVENQSAIPSGSLLEIGPNGSVVLGTPGAAEPLGLPAGGGSAGPLGSQPSGGGVNAVPEPGTLLLLAAAAACGLAGCRRRRGLGIRD